LAAFVSPSSPSTPGRPEVSIVLATLNERANLPVLVESIHSQTLPTHEIVVVDDGSTDGTRELLSLLSLRDSSVRPIFNDRPQTLTPAQCQGIAATRGEFVVIMDSDLQHPPRAIPDLVRKLEQGNDLVVATRYGVGASVGSRAYNRAIISRCAEILAKLLVPGARRTSDPISGFFAFRRDAYRPVNPKYRGYKLVLFLLSECRTKRVAEVSYHFCSRTNGSSKITRNWGFVKVFLIEAILARRDQNHVASRSIPSVSAEGSLAGDAVRLRPVMVVSPSPMLRLPEPSQPSVLPESRAEKPAARSVSR